MPTFDELRFESSGPRSKVLSDLDAGISAFPDGILLGAKQYVRSTIAALPDVGWYGVSLQWYGVYPDNYTINTSYCAYPDPTA